MTATILRGDARHLPLADASVDLIVTSPPYFALRSYTDGGEHYDGQIGAEPTPADYVDNLIACTREWVRVLKPSGSIWVNLGDKYNSAASGQNLRDVAGTNGRGPKHYQGERGECAAGIRSKSLIGLPWRYALRCIDDLGLILRAEVIWSKPNGLPESVTDRVRRSHEHWFHFVRSPRYYAAVDTIREPHTMRPQRRHSGRPEDLTPRLGQPRQAWSTAQRDEVGVDGHPLGKLPGSVWEIAEGESVIRVILRAVADGGLSVDEAEELWTNARRSGSSLTWTSPATAGNGSDGRTPAATARRASWAPDGRSGRTGTPTDCSSGRSPTASPSTTSAATRPAYDPTTSRSSPGPRTSDERIPNATSVPPVTPSPTPTSSAPDTEPPADAADPATWDALEHAETVWTVPTEPLRVPPELGIDHFAAFPGEFPRRIVLGWSPSGICTACGEGRRPIARQVDERYAAERARVRQRRTDQQTEREAALYPSGRTNTGGFSNISNGVVRPEYAILGEACACPDTSAPIRPAVVVDPFGGTGTTALVAKAYGRRGVSVDMSADYCRLARWRTTDPGELARAMRVEKPPKQADGQGDLFDLAGVG